MAECRGGVIQIERLVHFGVAVITILVLIFTNKLAALATSAILLTYCTIGFGFAKREYHSESISHFFQRVILWPYYSVKLIKSEIEIQYRVYINDVYVGNISRQEISKIKGATDKFELAKLQLSTIWAGAIKSAQIVSSYTGGFIVWGLIIGIHTNRMKTIEITTSILKGEGDEYISILLAISAMLFISMAIHKTKNVYKNEINNRIRLTLNSPIIGDMKLQRDI